MGQLSDFHLPLSFTNKPGQLLLIRNFHYLHGYHRIMKKFVKHNIFIVKSNEPNRGLNFFSKSALVHDQ
jgi:hypothetical protein